MYPATYTQITTACNMHCPHCCYDCHYKGEYMSLDTFKAAIRWNKGRLNIGGGEPTLHPDLFEMIDIALAQKHRVWMVTNGKKIRNALRLAKMTMESLNANFNEPTFVCKLSQDPWHSPISEKVVEAFEDINQIHNVSKGKGPIKAGRWHGNKRVTCTNSNKPFVKPDGKVYQCGCKNAPVVGDVFTGFYPINGEWACYQGLPHEKPYTTYTLKAVVYEPMVMVDAEKIEVKENVLESQI